jgi:hypothetical protein
MRSIQAIWMNSMSTDVLILFNAQEPVKLVQNVIIKSLRVQDAFRASCGTDILEKYENDLTVNNNPLSFLYHFLIEGFIRVYSKDHLLT